MTENLQPGTITTLGALRPGDVGKFVNEDDTEGSLFLVMHKGIEIGTVRFTDAYDWRQLSCTVRYLGRGRIEPAKIVIEGESDRVAELEEQVRALREFIRECATNFDCDRDAHRYQTFCRQCEARAVLAATAPKEESCTT